MTPSDSDASDRPETPKFRFLFNRAIGSIESDDRITSDMGAVVVREVLHRLGVDSLIERIEDPRRQEWIRYTILEMIMFRVAMMACGYSAQDDADKLAHDPAFRISSWDRSGDAVMLQRLASQPTLSRLIGILATHPNFKALCDIVAAPILERLATAIGDGTGWLATLDIDGFPGETHGLQEKAAYNGYHKRKVFYPFVAMLSLDGDFDFGAADGVVGAMLRPGDASAADGAVEFIDEIANRVKTRLPGITLNFRVDAGFIEASVVNHIDARGEKFVGRVKSNPVLREMAEGFVNRKPGPRPKHVREYVYELGEYGAETWDRKHRLVLVVIDDPPTPGELDFGPRYFFLSTNHDAESMPAEKLLSHYRNRGTFEDRIGEFNSAIDVKLSHRKFRKNEVLLQLAFLAFNVLSVIRSELETDVVAIDLGRVQKRVMKAGARIVKKGRRLTLRLAETAKGWWDLLTARLASIRVPVLRKLRRCDFMSPPGHAHTRTPSPLLE